LLVFASEVTNMLKTGGPSERNRSPFDTSVEILREVKETAGIASILPNRNVSFKQSGCLLGFLRSSYVTRADGVMAVAIGYCEDMYFENRKRRPQERGRKKRRKGKWNPIDRLWNSANQHALIGLCKRDDNN
jgi:hypothetical protein